MSRQPEPARRYLDDDSRLDGRACVVCGSEHGPMVPVEHGPRGQVFAHEACVDSEGDARASHRCRRRCVASLCERSRTR